VNKIGRFNVSHIHAVNLGPKEEWEMAKRHENETYFEWYTRKLGSIDRYAKMTPKQLGRELAVLQSDLGATLVYLRRDPESITGNELLRLIEPHYEAVLKEWRR
jgi:hypothetical protein